MNKEQDNILTVTNVTKKFGGVCAVNDVSFSIRKGKIVALIGPNGAGKTTLFNTIAGVYVPSSGSIDFDNQQLKGKRQHVITKMGIARTFQIVRPFLKMTILENVMVGAMFGKKGHIGHREAKNTAEEFIKFVGLEKKKNVVASSLTLIDRKMAEIAKALACKPKLVLLDEPLSGLNPTEVEGAISLISKIRDDLGITVFWVEHVMDAVMNLADEIIVLNYGEKIAEETPTSLLDNQKVIDAYLGVEFTF